MTVIALDNLSKSFTERTWRTVFGRKKPRRIQALKGVSLSIARGEIFGLLGPNGAGKTTLIKILATLILPDSGTAAVCGHDLASHPERIRRTIGLVNSNERSFYWRLTGRQNLGFFAALYNLNGLDRTRRIQDLFTLVDLAEKADTPFMKYSTGQQQRLALARALLPDPEILLMDEPTRSLDPISASWFKGFARQELSLKNRKTILWCSHNLEEVQTVCDKLAIIHRGTLVADGAISDMRALITSETSFRLRMDREPAMAGMAYDRIIRRNGHIEMDITAKEENIPHILAALVDQNIKIFACTPTEPNLEDIFKKIITRNV